MCNLDPSLLNRSHPKNLNITKQRHFYQLTTMFIHRKVELKFLFGVVNETLWDKNAMNINKLEPKTFE